MESGCLDVIRKVSPCYSKYLAAMSVIVAFSMFSFLSKFIFGYLTKLPFLKKPFFWLKKKKKEKKSLNLVTLTAVAFCLTGRF